MINIFQNNFMHAYIYRLHCTRFLYKPIFKNKSLTLVPVFADVSMNKILLLLAKDSASYKKNMNEIITIFFYEQSDFYMSN